VRTREQEKRWTRRKKKMATDKWRGVRCGRGGALK
jgi:hypothetical protein